MVQATGGSGEDSHHGRRYGLARYAIYYVSRSRLQAVKDLSCGAVAAGVGCIGSRWDERYSTRASNRRPEQQRQPVVRAASHRGERANMAASMGQQHIREGAVEPISPQ